MKILVGLTEISGYGRNLVVGLRTLGATADLLDLSPGVYRYGEDSPPTRLMTLLQRVARMRAATPKSDTIPKVLAVGAQMTLTVLVLVQALARYDAFVFLYDSTFFGYRELRLMRLLGKRVVYVFCGSDVRPTYVDGALMAPSRGMSIDECIASVVAKRRMLDRVERHATEIVGHPGYSQLHRRPFVPFLVMGIPRDLGDGATVEGPSDGVPVVVHAPTHAEAKGTLAIREIMGRLRERGVEFVYDEIQGVPNHILLERLAAADLVIDMVWSDTPMAGLAADAAWFGCPTVVGGYGWDELRELTPRDSFPPTECCDPDSLEHRIEALLVDSDYRQRLGREAQAFVRGHWRADVVGSRFLRLLEGDVPPDWRCDPTQIRYVLGWGQPVDRSRAIVREVLDTGGRPALGLSDKPIAEQLLVDLARSQGEEQATLS